MLRRDIITPGALDLLKRLMADESCADFCLAGGTALAFHLGHRTSEDLDLFTDVPFDPEQLFARLKRYAVRRPLARSENTLRLRISGIKVEMLGYFYPRRAEVVVREGVRLFDLPDLVPMKLAAVSNRGARKDFYDLACFIERFGLRQCLEWYRAKFPASDIHTLLRSLVYFDDAEDQPEPHMLWPIAWGEVKERIAGAVAREVRG